MRIAVALASVALSLALPAKAQKLEPKMTNIGMMFQKDDGRTLSPEDFAPLIAPTSAVLMRIASAGGPSVEPNSIVGNVVSFPLLMLDASTILHTRYVLESNANKPIADALLEQRISEFQNLFSRFNAAPPEQVNALVSGAGTGKAAALVRFIIDAARNFSKGGPDAARHDSVGLRFVKLN